MILQDAHSAVDAAKTFYKIVWSENNFDKFYDETVTTGEEHNVDLPELLCYLRFQIENGSSQMYLYLQKHTSRKFFLKHVIYSIVS